VVNVTTRPRFIPESIWTQRLEEKSSASVGDRTPVFQSVVRHYTDRATPALGFMNCRIDIQYCVTLTQLKGETLQKMYFLKIVCREEEGKYLFNEWIFKA
jgi:hypothetical protein